MYYYWMHYCALHTELLSSVKGNTAEHKPLSDKEVCLLSND